MPRFAMWHRWLDRWLFRVGPPEAAPITLGQRRIFVLPTGAGLSFAGALLVMLIASVNYNLGLGYALVFLLGGVGVASMIHAFRNLLHLSLRPVRTVPAFAGETAEFHVLVDNGRDARRPALRLRSADASASFDLTPHETHELVLCRAARRRGWLPLGRVVLETTYPLGLIRAWSVLVPDLDGLVYPAPERDPPPLPQAAAEQAGKRPQRAGDDDFAGLRVHRRADSPRHVAWKVVARGGPLLTKEFADLEGGDLSLDWHDLPGGLDDEARLARLTAWVIAAGAGARTFSLILPDGRSARDSGALHVAACLKRLALFRLPASHDA
jgi:uncharacterized protein (DUF58 family)